MGGFYIGGRIMVEINQSERYSRQQDIVPQDRIANAKATVIGVGAIGRQVALQLAAIGVPWLQLVDFDTVEISNLASQGYLEQDLGKKKIAATADLVSQINTNIEVIEFDQRFRRTMDIGNTVFCCVDSIEIRKLIWEAVKDKVRFFTDGRMSAEVIRVLTAADSQSREHYPSTLFNSSEAYAGSCTAKTTIYCANIAAGLMIAQFTKYLRIIPVDRDIQFNVLSGEFSVILLV